MICYDRIDVSERIDVNKTSKSKECNVCQYCYFLSKGFEFKPNVFNGCHDLLMMCMNLTNIAVLNIKVLLIAVSLADLQNGGQKPISKYRFDRIKWNIIKHHNLLSHIKTREEILTFGYIEIEKKKKTLPP